MHLGKDIGVVVFLNRFLFLIVRRLLHSVFK